MATVIASQAVISGAFSVSRQAIRLGLLPRLNVKHTSKEEGGQIYIGSINWILFVGVVLLIGVFQSSEAPGLRVRPRRHRHAAARDRSSSSAWPACVWQVGAWKIVVAVVLDRRRWSWSSSPANLAKVVHGGWLPLLIAVRRRHGHDHLARPAARPSRPSASQHRGPAGRVHRRRCTRRQVPRVPGVAVFPHPNATTTPLALRQNVEFNHVLHEHVVIVSIVNENVPHIRHVDRARVDDLGYTDDGIVHVAYRVGFNDSQDVPKALLWAQGKLPRDGPRPRRGALLPVVAAPGRRADRSLVDAGASSSSCGCRPNAANRTTVFHLPPERTVVMGGHAEL